jgi:hypothetical protein
MRIGSGPCHLEHLLLHLRQSDSLLAVVLDPLGKGMLLQAVSVLVCHSAASVEEHIVGNI